jgi:hypothetical protein
MLCCESTSEERSAGMRPNPHATLCGSRERVTAPDDPVGSGDWGGGGGGGPPPPHDPVGSG